MLFPTVEFALFFAATFALSWACFRLPTCRKLILIAASYVFYGWWDPRFVLLLFECTIINYVLALALTSASGTKQRQLLLTVGVAANLGVLAYFKYVGFFLASLHELLRSLGMSSQVKILEVVLPVGISFYTFQGISYLVDVYRGELEAVRNPIDMLLFKAFFPQLVAGPIVRASEFLPQLLRPKPPTELRATRAFLLIAFGLCKKVVVAHYLAVDLVTPAFAAPETYSSADLLLAVYGYALQIYCDFSAYSDIAIGVALLFGFEFPVNFNQPYRAQSLQDFWRRWHMSLSRFLKDYLYIPLGGSRGASWRTYRNLLLTMVLGGLWHGAAWTFVIWGLLHGLGLGLERGLARLVGPWRLPKLVQTLLTFHLVCLAWVFFNADSLPHAWHFLAAMAHGGSGLKLVTPFSFGLLFAAFVAQYLPEDLLDRLEGALGRVPLPLQATGLAFVVVAITAVSPGALAPFIYFRF